MDSEALNNKPIQKKPGRPKKKLIIKPENVINGIITKPNDNVNAMELIYTDPKIFKKIFGMFRGYYVDDIFINFTEDKVLMSSRDHTKKTIIKIELDCNKISEYFCKRNFNICVKREYLEKIFSTIEKNHSKIILFSKEDTYKSSLEINLINEDLSIHDNYIIDLSLQQCDIEDTISKTIETLNKDMYSIKFNVKSKSFKKFINDTSANGKLLTIEKVGDNNLQFKMCFNNKINFTRTIINESGFNISSKLSDNDFFNVNMELEYIKPFSNMNINDYITVYIDNENKKVIFECIIDDNLFVINIYNNIINYVINND